MFPIENGSVRLFRVAGINVWLHWSWLAVAFWAISARQGLYASSVWNVVEYVSLFAVVLLHEFGHAFATRQVHGTANRIVLWPLGGIAFVSAPNRASAQLWSIAAGPLVNVALIPIIYFSARLMISTGIAPESDDFWIWMGELQRINKGLLIFNILPLYPLDGGQILRSLLWFKLGARRSLLVASGAGLVVLVILVIRYWSPDIWFIVMAGFLGMNCWRAFQSARMKE